MRIPPWLKAVLIAALFVWGVFAVALIRPLLRAVLGRRYRRAWDRVRTHWNATACAIIGLRVRITGEPCRQAGLMVANHISWLDITALASVQNLDFIAKEDVAHWPVMGYLAKGVNTLFVRRGDSSQTQAIAEQMTWRIRQGRQLMLFPESTTTTGERVLRFHAKLFKPAHLAETAVQAIALRYSDERAAGVVPFVGEDDFLPHLWRVLQLEQPSLHLHFGKPHAPGWSPANIAQLTRNQIVEALEESHRLAKTGCH
jgi:lyso-ornithine lipid O-acyltransferase